MNKCQSCGTEFEGNFCPSCGVRVGQKRKCPKCGAEVSENARFCNGCGSLLLSREEEARNRMRESQPTQARPSAQTNPPFFSTERKRSIFANAPTVLFCLFTALLFIFYALSTAKIGDSEIGWESLGSIYTMSSSELLLSVPQIKWLLVMMIILLCLCALHSILMLANLKYAFLEKLEKFSFVYYALYLIASITICIYLAVEGEGAFAAGAGTVCILVFSILSVLLGGASLYLRKKFYEKNPKQSEGKIHDFTKVKEVIKKFCHTILFCLFTASILIFSALPAYSRFSSSLGYVYSYPFYSFSSETMPPAVACIVYSIVMIAKRKNKDSLMQLEKFTFVFYSLYFIYSLNLGINILSSATYILGGGLICIFISSIVAILLGILFFYLRRAKVAISNEQPKPKTIRKSPVGFRLGVASLVLIFNYFFPYFTHFLYFFIDFFSYEAWHIAQVLLPIFVALLSLILGCVGWRLSKKSGEANPSGFVGFILGTVTISYYLLIIIYYLLIIIFGILS